MAGSNTELVRRAHHNPAEILKFRVPASGASPDWDPLQALLEYADKLAQENEQLTQKLNASSVPAERTAERMAKFAAGVARRAQRATNATGAILALRLPDGDIVCVGRCGAAPEIGARLNPAAGISGKCVRSGEPQLCGDTSSDPSVDAAVCAELGIRSLAMAPLQHAGVVFGLVAVFSDKSGYFDQDDVGMLRRLEQLVAQALDQPTDAVPPEEPAVPPPTPASQESRPRTPPEVTPIIRAGLRAAAPPQRTGPVSPARVAPNHTHPGRPQRRWVLVLSVGVVLAILGAAWQLALRRGPAPPQPQKTSAVAAAPLPSSAPETNDVATTGADGITRLHSIEHWSAAGTSRVTLLLDGPVQYSAHRLQNPERIYFDLRGVRLPPEMTHPAPEQGGLVRQIRVAAYDADTVRVVLDLRARYAYNIALLSKPPRLRIEVFDSAR